MSKLEESESEDSGAKVARAVAQMAFLSMIVKVLVYIPLWMVFDEVTELSSDSKPFLTAVFLTTSVCTSFLVFVSSILQTRLDPFRRIFCFVFMTVFVEGALEVAAFIMMCIRTEYWWNLHGDTGRAFYVLVWLSLCSSYATKKEMREQIRGLNVI